MENEIEDGIGALPPEARVSLPAGNCPVQAFGTWGGDEVYFRARGDRWSLEAGPGREASGILANAGWMPPSLVAEIVRPHLWSWSWSARGLDVGPAGDLRRALRALDPPGVRSALSRGADPNGAPDPEGPAPLAMALALCDEVGAGGGVDEDPSGLAVPAGLLDSERVCRRLECARALLEAGADPNGPPGAGLAPIHWAAMLPSGQAGATWGMVYPHPIADDDAAAAYGRARARERDDVQTIAAPIWELLGAGADPRVRRRARDALDWAALCEAGGALRELARRMGGDAPMRGALATVARAAGERSMLKTMSGIWAASGTGAQAAAADSFVGDSFQVAVGSFSSGAWPLEWLAGSPELAGGEAREMADEIGRRARAALESRELESASRSAPPRPARPGL